MRLKSFLDARIWVPKPVYWSPKCPGFIAECGPRNLLWGTPDATEA